MPYPGIKPNSQREKDMESCVMDVMADPKMKSKYPDHKERKSHSIAICRASIMGKGDEKIMDYSQDYYTITFGEWIE